MDKPEVWEKLVAGLRETIARHGPITGELIGSAVKRQAALLTLDDLASIDTAVAKFVVNLMRYKHPESIKVFENKEVKELQREIASLNQKLKLSQNERRRLTDALALALNPQYPNKKEIKRLLNPDVHRMREHVEFLSEASVRVERIKELEAELSEVRRWQDDGGK